MCVCIHITLYLFYPSFFPTPHPQLFGPVLNLIPLAESVVKLKAVCMICFKDAAFTKRLGSEKQVCLTMVPIKPHSIRSKLFIGGIISSMQ